MGAETIESPVIVDDEQFEYLRWQKGALFDLSHDRERWQAAYETDLRQTYEGIQKHLPDPCWGVLDIGSGLGGIDVLITRHYQPDPPYIHLLDGEDDAPRMRRHRQTFNSMTVARRFLVANGVRADRINYFTIATNVLPRPYDLVLSLGSWCFHYPPDTYLPLLLSGGGLHIGTVLVMDVRNGKPEYSAQISESLDRVAVIKESSKYTRAVYRRKR
jgi:SAM-dependent methyltransferase